MPDEPETHADEPDAADRPDLVLEVVPEQDDEDRLGDLRRTLVNHARIRADYANTDLWMVHFDVTGKEGGEHPTFRTILHDLSGYQVVEASGRMGEPDSVVVTPTNRERRPSLEEFTYALGVVRSDPETARRLDEGELQAYWPMPPLASTVNPDGAIDRAITIGLRDPQGEPRHRILAVRNDDGHLVHDHPHVPKPSSDDCGSEPGEECDPTVGPPRARVRVRRGEDTLWDLTVVRPSASSGANGSGVELRDVTFQGHRMLHRAHVPILNVSYDPDAGGCGPSYRDWLNEESCFEAEGDDAGPGWRVCTAAPRTILDGGTDGGGFRGVALWLDGDELVILSQLRAGWYRYVSEWRLHADGTVRPRFGFAAVRNPCTCRSHTHHAYWRLDFDITGPDNNLVQEYNDPPVGGTLTPWQTMRFEVRRPRDAAHKRIWRVRHARSSLGYTIVPGADDGTADAYGAGDLWVLAFHPDEIDDGQGFTTDPALSRVQIDRFVTGEELSRADVVVWYGVHSPHGAGGEGSPPDGGDGSRLGPDLTPFNWRPRVQQEPFAPLVPPSVDDSINPAEM